MRRDTGKDRAVSASHGVLTLRIVLSVTKIIMRISTLLLISSLLLALAACGGPDTPSSPPNVVFIYADDLGYGDLSCYDADSIDTPYLDQMAADGMRFTNFYSTSPICSPSRTGLLTGRYQVREGVTRVFFPNSLQGLDTAAFTMAEMFRAQGYATGIVGKWHLGHLPEYLPMNQGFDYWFGLPYSNDMEWEPRNDPPLPLMRNLAVIDQPAYQPTLTQRYTSEAIQFIAQHRNEPFFLYFPHTFPHKPLHVSAEYAGSSELGKYGDVVQELDRSVGEVLLALETWGLSENTLVIFSSDNGPAARGGGKSGGLRGHKATTFEGGIKVPTIAQWKGKIDPGQVEETPAIMLDWLPTFARLTGYTFTENQPIDGEDIGDLLWGTYVPHDRDFFFYFNEDLRAVRSGRWKYKKAVVNNPYRQPLEAHADLLFDLETDPNETRNLADTQPEKLHELQQTLQRFLEELGEPPEPRLKEVPYADPRKGAK